MEQAPTESELDLNVIIVVQLRKYLFLETG